MDGIEDNNIMDRIIRDGTDPDCINEDGEEKNKRNTGGSGVLGASAGVVGSLMAAETAKVLLGLHVQPCFYYIDLISTRLVPIDAEKKENCPVCGK